MKIFSLISKDKIRCAVVLALTTAVISGTNNFLTKIAVTAVRDPIVFTTLKNGVVALFLIGIFIILRKWTEIMSLTRRDILRLFVVGLIGGSIPFALYFTGLAKTTAINASLIHKTLFLWVALLAIPILKERVHPVQWIGIALIFGANLAIGGFTGFKYNIGELMILTAVVFWAVENIIAKMALANISSFLLAGARMTIGSIILLGVVAWQDKTALFWGLDARQWGWTLLTSLLLCGYVITWYTALKYAPATLVATLLVPATLVTNVLSAIFITHAFPKEYLINAALLFAGTALVIFFVKKTPVVRLQDRKFGIKPAA